MVIHDICQVVSGQFISRFIKHFIIQDGSFGVQLIGQAVQHTRERGGEVLYAVLPPQSDAETFFQDCGFLPQEPAAGGRLLLVKQIGFDPDILGKS